MKSLKEVDAKINDLNTKIVALNNLIRKETNHNVQAHYKMLKKAYNKT